MTTVHHPAAAPVGLPAVFSQAVQLLAGVQPPPPSLQRLQTLAGRLANNRLHIAVLGQFKRGKSSLLNALLGAEVLPTAVLPLTSVPIFIMAGGPPSLRLHYRNGGSTGEDISGNAAALQGKLRELATEEGNPHNQMGIERIDVRYPAPLLAEGTMLIDTPGIGSTHRHNTDATLQFLPQCDAGLFVLSPDPPITETEIAFLDQVKAEVPRLVFVLNKVDYLGSADRDTLVAFLQSVLRDHLGGTPDIHCLSARQALLARQTADAGLMAASGLAAFEQRVMTPLARDKACLLRSALARRSAAALAEARLDLDVAIGALRMPLDELGARLSSFQSLLPRFEAERLAAQDLLAGDRKRVLAELEDQAERLRQRASLHLGQTIRSALAAAPADPEAAARTALAEAIPAFFDAALGRLSSSFAVHMREVFASHQRRAADLIDAVRQAAAELFDLPWRPAADRDVLELSRQPYWLTQDMAGALIPLAGGLFDRLLPRQKRMARLADRLSDVAGILVARNVENLRWATLQNVETAFRRFRHDLDQGLAGAIEATHGSISAAFDQRRAESGRIGPQIERLTSISAGLAVLGEQAGLLVGDAADAPMERS